MDVSIIGNYIKQKRIENGLTQLQIANELGISPQAVSKWERYESLPDIMTLSDLGKILKVSTNDLLNGGIDKNKTNPEELVQLINSFVNEEFFEAIFQGFVGSDSIEELKIPLEIFMFLNNLQKEKLLDVFLEIENSSSEIDKIIFYFNKEQKDIVLKNLLKHKEYRNIENLLPFLTNSNKKEILLNYLENKNFEEIENILPFLTKIEKDYFIKSILNNKLEEEIIQNFLPFFNKLQQEYIFEKLGGTKNE